jgi:hypothetical protein
MCSRRPKLFLVPMVVAGVFALMPTSAKAQSVDDIFHGTHEAHIVLHCDGSITANDVNISDLHLVPVVNVLHLDEIHALHNLVHNDPDATAHVALLTHVLHGAHMLGDTREVVGILHDVVFIYHVQ